MHKDLTYQEALSQEPGFCDWVIKTSQGPDARGKLVDFAQWLQEQGVPSVGGGAPVHGIDLRPTGDTSGWGSGPPAAGPSGDSGQRLVGFSMHKDLTYQEALSQEPGFCDWVIKTSQGPDARGKLVDFAQWLQEQGIDPLA